MPHFREQIRNDLVTVLKGNTLASTRVYPGSPPANLDGDNLPAIYISTTETTIEPVSTKNSGGRHTQHRETTVDIAVVVRGTAGDIAEDQADDLCVVIEELVFDDQPGSLLSWNLVSESTSVDNQTGEQIFVEHVLTYIAVYATPQGSPSYYA